MFLTKSGPQVINYEIHCDFNKRITDLSRLLQWGEEKTTWTSLHLKADVFYLLLGVVDTQSKFRQLSSPSNVNWDVDVLMGVFFFTICLLYSLRFTLYLLHFWDVLSLLPLCKRFDLSGTSFLAHSKSFPHWRSKAVTADPDTIKPHSYISVISYFLQHIKLSTWKVNESMYCTMLLQ